MAADEFKTLREVGHGIEGIKSTLNLYAAVFGGVVVIAGAAYGFIFNKLDNVETSVAKMEATLDAIAGDIKQTKADVGDVKTAMSDSAPPTKEELNLVARLKDAFGTQLVPANSHVVRTISFGEVEMLAKGLPPEKVKDLSIPCAVAKDKPAMYSLTSLGACAAIMNAVGGAQ